MSLTRRSLLAAGALVPAAGLTGIASAAWAGRETTAAAVTMPVGYSSPPANQGLPSLEDTEKLTGRRATVVREYVNRKRPVPTSIGAAGKSLTYLQQGRAVSLSLRPPDESASNLANARSMAADIVAKGYANKMWITIWAEPNRNKTPQTYKASYNAYYPIFMEHGIRVGPCFQMYPYYHKSIDWIGDWYTGDDTADFIDIDVYPGDKTGSIDEDPLGTIAPITGYAKSHGKPFAIAEFGVPEAKAAADPAGAKAWIEKFERLGHSCEYLTYYIGSGYALTANNGVLVPAFQQLYDTFQ